MIPRIKRLIMESMPYEPGGRTDYNSLLGNTSSYCDELGFVLEREDFNQALGHLNDEQCLVFFSQEDIRTTQFGLNRYSSWQ